MTTVLLPSGPWPKVGVRRDMEPREIMSVREFLARYKLDDQDTRALKWLLNGEIAAFDLDQHVHVTRYSEEDSIRDAAGDLLAAAEAALPHLEAMVDRTTPPGFDDSHYSDRRAVNLLRAAIAKARGFALIELLVVIALLAVLLAVLLPGLAGARAAGQAAVCRANLRSLATATLAYAHQHGHLPRAGLVVDLDAPDGLGAALGLPSAVWRCPADPEEGPSYHYAVGGLMASWGPPPLIRLNQLDHDPARAIFAERGHHHGAPLAVRLDGSVR